MTFLIGGANSLAGGYDIDNSLRVERADSPKLSKTVSTATNTTKLTLSLWYKLGEPVDMGFLSKFADGNNRFHLRIMAAGHLLAYNNIAGTYHYKTTTAQFRDHSAWYHFMFVYDTDDSTAADRVKIYANGVRLTSFVNNTNPGDGEALKIASDTSNPLKVLCSNDEDAYLSGYVSDFYYIDGDNKAPTDFGEYNSDGIWVPKEYTGGFGNNGFKLEFKQVGVGTASASTVGADTSGNDHHLTSANIAATDITTDTPTNNFCTLNPLSIQYDSNGGSPSGMVHREGNTQAMNNTSSGWGSTLGTFLIPTSGKWYWELKNIPGDDHIQFGVMEHGYRATTGAPLDSSGLGWGWYSDDGNTRQNGYGGRVSGYSTWKDENDIIMIAYDANNGKMWLGLDGTWEDDSGGGGTTGDPAAGSNQTFTVDSVPVVPCLGTANINSGTGPSVNFGNPPYANSSSQADDNGYGDFEYDVPAGFYALCSKNLAKYGG